MIYPKDFPEDSDIDNIKGNDIKGNDGMTTEGMTLPKAE